MSPARTYPAAKVCAGNWCRRTFLRGSFLLTFPSPFLFFLGEEAKGKKKEDEKKKKRKEKKEQKIHGRAEGMLARLFATFGLLA